MCCDRVTPDPDPLHHQTITDAFQHNFACFRPLFTGSSVLQCTLVFQPVLTSFSNGVLDCLAPLVQSQRRCFASLHFSGEFSHLCTFDWYVLVFSWYYVFGVWHSLGVWWSIWCFSILVFGIFGDLFGWFGARGFLVFECCVFFHVPLCCPYVLAFMVQCFSEQLVVFCPWFSDSLLTFGYLTVYLVFLLVLGLRSASVLPMISFFYQTYHRVCFRWIVTQLFVPFGFSGGLLLDSVGVSWLLTMMLFSPPWPSFTP